MIKIINSRQEGEFLTWKEYYKGKGVLARIIMPVTKRLRTYYAGKYIQEKEAHLDIGCGDGYLMKKSKCLNVYGLDSKYGDFITDKLDFPDNYFDYITMLAVIEHFEAPEAIFREIHRVLKENGFFIFTTPAMRSERIISLYYKNINDSHVQYYDLESVQQYSKGLFQIADYKTFIFGLNQIFCLEKS
jgi:2-polyprenyl-3-methyl-5-hydroxy-6-metoxy-1,4-benzoquinol methylase